MDACDDLDTTVDACADRFRALKIPDGTEGRRLDLWLVTTAIFMRTAGLAEGIWKLLLPRKVVPGAGPVFRAAFELAVEFDFLLDSSDPARNATKFLIAGALEEQAAYQEIRSAGTELPEFAGLDIRVQHYREIEADLFAEVLQQREKRQFHWSGETRTKLFANATGQPLVYRVLSWDSHPIGAGRSFSVEERDDGGTLSFDGEVLRFLDAEQLAAFTTAMLRKMSSRYDTTWNIAA